MSATKEPPVGAAMSVTIGLPADARAASIARKFVEDHHDSIRPELVEDTQLLVSELVANAVRHGKPDITLQIRVDPPGIRIGVSDVGEDFAYRPSEPPAPEKASGRGLLIVDAVASKWGVRPNPDDLPGKTVWFEITPH